MQTELPKDYYLDYFDQLISFVISVYGDLLTVEDKYWVASYSVLSLDSKRVLLRMVMRKGEVFRLSKLQYAEVDDVKNALDSLAKNKLIRYVITSNEVCLYLNKFTKAELVEWFPQRSLKSLKKEDLIAKLLEVCASEIICEVLLKFDSLVMLESHRFFLKMFLLYFGNPNQDLTEFVLSHLGVMIYESYAIDKLVRPFSSNDDIDSSLRLYDLQVLFADIEARQAYSECSALYSDLKYFDCFQNKPRSFNSFVISIARFLEKCKQPNEAFPFFELTDKEPSRERRARILLSNQDLDASAKLISQMLQEPFSEKEFEVGLVLNKKLKKYGLELLIDPPVEEAFEEETVYLKKKDDLSVEQLLCELYDGNGDDAYFYENQFMGGLLGLVFWDIIFSPQFGVFYHPFQLGPSDLFSLEFYLQRQPLIDKRFSELERGDFGLNELLLVFEKKYGISNYLVQWDLFDRELLSKAWVEIPIKVLLSIFKRQVVDMRQFYSGMPDVLNFPKDGGYCFVEVKGPGDRLQTNQKNWFRYFSKNEINSKIVWVKWKN